MVRRSFWTRDTREERVSTMWLSPPSCGTTGAGNASCTSTRNAPQVAAGVVSAIRVNPPTLYLVGSPGCGVPKGLTRFRSSTGSSYRSERRDLLTLTSIVLCSGIRTGWTVKKLRSAVAMLRQSRSIATVGRFPLQKSPRTCVTPGVSNVRGQIRCKPK